MIMIVGAGGQLARCIIDYCTQHMISFVALTRQQLDLLHSNQIYQALQQYQPYIVINAAAYTDVDQSEVEQDLAWRGNVQIVENLAKACQQQRCWLVHFSTDYVFSGLQLTPYTEQDVPNPINYYGYTKWMGEQVALQHHDWVIIFRLSWLFSRYGKNFFLTMYRLLQQQSLVRVVHDQIGAPSYAPQVVQSLMPHLLQLQPEQAGIYHCSASGATSWYDFARVIQSYLPTSPSIIQSITSDAYPSLAQRPSYSILSTEKLQHTWQIFMPHWQEGVAQCYHALNGIF
jgi:dTDP-4-dehydrorhamnose reductase